MDTQHYRSLESLSFYCHFCGLLPTFLGILIVFFDVVNQAFDHIQVGLFMFMTGYAQVKISEKIDVVLRAERKKFEETISTYE